jgi:cobaltochelatase CobN
MHLLSAMPGGFVDDAADVVRIQQEPADIVVLSAADTTLALLAAACERLPKDFPSVRLCNLMHLRQPASVDLYVDDVLRHARVVLVDHLGGQSYWPYGTERLVALARERKQVLVMFSGDRVEDPNLLSQSTASGAQCRALWRYLRESGPGNAEHFFRFIGEQFLGWGEAARPPRPLPEVAIYSPQYEIGTIDEWRTRWRVGAPVVAIVFYRAHLTAGNTAVFDDLIASLERHELNPLPVALGSLKDPACLQVLRDLCVSHDVSLILNTTAFSTAAVDDPRPQPLAGDVPVIQVMLSGGNHESWMRSPHGLNPRDIAMQVALPEVDGRIISRAVSFKGRSHRCGRTQFDVARYQSEPERIEFVAELGRRWCRLRQLRNSEKRVALVLANYPTREGRIGNGVGLDTPASVIVILRALEAQGYGLEGIPADGDALMSTLTQGITNDPDTWPIRWARQSLTLEAYREFLAGLPAECRQSLVQRWGPPERDPMLRQGRFMIAGLRIGHVFVGIQPARGDGEGSFAAYHSADLVPRHHYLAFYLWLRRDFACDAVVHVGKHGNLEWLPGKSVALSERCWPDLVLGPMPHLYPFIVNDPGEGSQAKRRAQAVIIDHLMPPLTRAESYGPLQDLERHVDEYYEALVLDPARADILRKRILAEILAHNLHDDLGLGVPQDAQAERALLARMDAYLCELKESQIRDGLHVFGQSPREGRRRDTLMALARFPIADGRGANAGLLHALARDLQLDGFDPLDADWAAPWTGPRPPLLEEISADPWRHCGDTRERLEALALRLLGDSPPQAALPATAQVLERIRVSLQPALDACGAREIQGLCDGLSGKFVAPGPSGAPSRGRPDVLPTGRNFYSVDTRAIPTPTAWQLGFKSAARLIERYLQEHGEYPRSIGLSVWGTATMRTGGDDIAQALALLGVRPVWSAGSYRVADFEILPLSVLDRPRIDVMLRVSGFFRDAFASLIHVFDAAVQAVAALDEPAESNPIRARVLEQTAALAANGVSPGEARLQAGWRVFGARPGAYGAGLQELLDRGAWRGDADLAAAYCESGGYAYSAGREPARASERFAERLAEIDLVLQNQDNREHDLLDSADYALFQGGMIAAVRHFGGRQPQAYFGDHANPSSPRIRSLEEETSRVIRARVVNPKWLEGVRRHGYKGAFEMAATVDCLFAYDATAHVLSDYQYELVANSYVNDEDSRAFLRRHNPEALHNICERLLEAIRRGLWEAPGAFTEQLEGHLLECEAELEGRSA